MNITTSELREKFQKFFEKKNHKRISNSSLIPENDPSVLFTTAGMHPLVPFLMGEIHPKGKRLTNCQKCIRTGDIEEVGDNWHLSFFEMLGNWSLGDYFKKEAIEYSFEFLLKELELEVDKISVTCFKGDKDSPKDLEAAITWEKLGIKKQRIHFLGKKDNWWGPAGVTGPCGPDTEMFYRVKGSEEENTIDFVNRKDDFPEIWNDVFMQYNKTIEEKFVELKQKNVDTGLGLERTVAVLNGFDNIFEVDTIKPIFEVVKKLSKNFDEKNKEHLKSSRIITDHLRASVMILGDNKKVVPSNVDQGYVLRRFIRRSIRHARLIGINDFFCKTVGEVVVRVMGSFYKELEENKEFILVELEKEEKKFSKTIESGIKLLEKKIVFLKNASIKELDSKDAFDLYQSYGFPIEMTIEFCKEKNIFVDKKGFEKLLKKHQELSRKGAEQKFKGGLADSKEDTTRLHTCAHLTLSGLKKILSKDIEQKGSNINSERLRFDFNFDRKLTLDEIKKIEDFVNNAIKEKAVVKMSIMSFKEALEQNAHGTFLEKYGEKVKVYTIEKDGKIFSKEICGGPHVDSLENLGVFKIIKEESSSAGIRRIKAVLK